MASITATLPQPFMLSGRKPISRTVQKLPFSMARGRQKNVCFLAKATQKISESSTSLGFYKSVENIAIGYGIGYGSIIKRKERKINYITTKPIVVVFVVHATDGNSEKFEIDTDKARDALQQLDQQFQSLSDKKISSPKIKASDKRPREDMMMAEEPPEMSESFLGYSAFVLLAITIFYNVLFYSVIKPSIDGPIEISDFSLETVVTMSDAVFLQCLPSLALQG